MKWWSNYLYRLGAHTRNGKWGVGTAGEGIRRGCWTIYTCFIPYDVYLYVCMFELKPFAIRDKIESIYGMATWPLHLCRHRNSFDVPLQRQAALKYSKPLSVAELEKVSDNFSLFCVCQCRWTMRNVAIQFVRRTSLCP